MTSLTISIEGLSRELMDAYVSSGMERGKGGENSINWAFGSNPKPFAVAREDGRIVGMSAYILSHMKYGTVTGTGLQAVDSFVSSNMRGRGVFTKLAQAYDDHAKQSGADLVWGFPNDNAAPAWFGKLGWQSHGQVPFLIKPLRSGLFLRKLGLPLDFPVSFSRDQNIVEATEIGDWADRLWENISPGMGCSTVRDREFLTHRLINAPQASEYRIVADTNPQTASVVATREANKHGGQIAYLMEAMGGLYMAELLMSEIGRLRSRGVELVLAWSFPGSANYKTLRKAGFIPLPQRVRPIRIWFGNKPQSAVASCANDRSQWYLSYLDSDTV
jgi:GNAT superfamily N-acetyltransferase